MRIVFFAAHGDAEYTRHTALCSARMTTMCGYSLAVATCAHARVDMICLAHVLCDCRAAVKLLIKIHGRYSQGAPQGVMRGMPYRRDQSVLMAEGCIELKPAPTPTVMLTPRALTV